MRMLKACNTIRSKINHLFGIGGAVGIKGAFESVVMSRRAISSSGDSLPSAITLIDLQHNIKVSNIYYSNVFKTEILIIVININNNKIITCLINVGEKKKKKT